MSTAFRRSPAHGWMMAFVAVGFGAIGLAVVVGVARHGLGELLHPSMMLLAGIPLTAAAGLGYVAARWFRHRRLLVTLDAAGVKIKGRSAIPWDEVGAIVVTETHVGYGPRQHISFRRRFTPSDIAATGAERIVHNLFTDQSFAPSHVDLTVAEMLAEIDARLTHAGLQRVEPPVKHFRLVQSVRRWEVRRTDARA